MSILDYAFCKYAFDLKRPNAKQAKNVIEKLSLLPTSDLSYDEARTLLDYTIYKTRENLDNALKVDFARTSGKYGLEQGIYAPHPNFLGYCGFSQIVSGLALISLDLDLKGGVLQSIDPDCPHYHAFNTLRLSINNKDTYFLLDPNSLREGYIKLTLEIAHEYLAINFDGKPPFKTAEESFSFLINPLPHKHIFDPPTAQIAQKDGNIFTLKSLSKERSIELIYKAGGNPLITSLGL